MPRKRAGAKRPVAGQPVEIPVSWALGQDIPTQYANQLLISHGGPEFILVFGVLTPPLTLDPTAIPDKIEIQPVVKIAVTHEVMMQFSEAIQRNIQKKMDNQGKEAKP